MIHSLVCLTVHRLQEQLECYKQDDIPIALLFVDLDGFKKINDTFGHETGDKVLKQTAKRLNLLRDKQHILCRWGGDEFLIAFMGANEADALSYANKVIEKISEFYDVNNNRLSLGATIGIAHYPMHTRKADELIQLADTAMYYQKKNHPCSVGVFNVSMRQRILRENILKNGLPLAIDKQQLRVVFQPIVQAKDQNIVSFEALLRWNFHGENVSPDEFITIAEQYGLIVPIGTWVLQQSCLAAAQWAEYLKNVKPSVSVNVSLLQLNSPNFIDTVTSSLNIANLSANKLTIEITESIFASDKAILFERIKKLQSLGIKVSIDDFGTEYSSLSVIQDLAADIIKIDRSFVGKLNSNGLPIIEAIKQMATKLNYTVVAEGVETIEQVKVLTELDVEMLQGYYFGKPLELVEIKDYLLKHSI
ncbi:bifunctional diguanylate cyclase/phosphodiesterase [Paraglaciecola aquimarina]|uniref:Bifunctional diguanylate cyclase/phosphodiesterase n=1 Tax=Paraglaciecola algarum TaxID=3050085 RepID=A0ABS9D535_9ALTE|nr:bifunctional diguanylate cyclase/phosphodiesterase [Paraglaciecola sp. G1-23]MCF2947122.1 bifunctional diguanylate cyclase/phosphodiesterase [Paraglaciecola sp. G1-23]